MTAKRTRNQFLASMRESQNLSPREMAETVGISYTYYLQFEARTATAMGPRGWRPVAICIAECLGLEPEDIWPEEIPEDPQVEVVTPITPEEALSEKMETVNMRTAVRDVLSEREQDIVYRRFTLGQSLGDIGAAHGTNKHRMCEELQRILTKLRKHLRHETRTLLAA
jgi:transcriptional regulator with XRE-family HTH domain